MLAETTSSLSKEHPSLTLEMDKDEEEVGEITTLDQQCLFCSYTTSKLQGLNKHLNHAHVQCSKEDSSAEISDGEVIS